VLTSVNGTLIIYLVVLTADLSIHKWWTFLRIFGLSTAILTQCHYCVTCKRSLRIRSFVLLSFCDLKLRLC